MSKSDDFIRGFAVYSAISFLLFFGLFLAPLIPAAVMPVPVFAAQAVSIVFAVLLMLLHKFRRQINAWGNAGAQDE